MNIDLDAAFVIPNTVRNLAGKKEEIHRFALNDKLMVNCYAGYTESAPLVIPNIVRNPASNALGVRPFGLGR